MSYTVVVYRYTTRDLDPARGRGPRRLVLEAGSSPWQTPPGRPHHARLRRDIRLRVLAVRVRARPRPPAGRTPLLLHAWSACTRRCGRPARSSPGSASPGSPAACPGPPLLWSSAAGAVAGVALFTAGRTVTLTMIGAAMTRPRRHDPAHLRPGRLVGPARRPPRPRADRGQRRRGRLRGGSPRCCSACSRAPRRPGGRSSALPVIVLAGMYLALPAPAATRGDGRGGPTRAGCRWPAGCWPG